MVTSAFAQGLLYGGNHRGRIGLAVDRKAHQICPRRIPSLAIMWERQVAPYQDDYTWFSSEEYSTNP